MQYNRETQEANTEGSSPGTPSPSRSRRSSCVILSKPRLLLPPPLLLLAAVSLLRHQEVDVVNQSQRRSAGLISLVRHAVLPDQKLFEVPSDIGRCNRDPRNERKLRDHRGGLRADSLQECVQGMKPSAVHIDLLREREVRNVAISWADIFQTIKDFSINPGFLVDKLGARKTENNELRDLGQQRVVLRVVDDRHASE